MFILDTDHVSLFQRNDPQVSARVLATPSQELATTVITVEEQGVRIGTHDLRIAATVLSCGATLVTRSVRDFATIPSLNIEDWSLPREDATPVIHEPPSLAVSSTLLAPR